jgi:hypothetical protein
MTFIIQINIVNNMSMFVLLGICFELEYKLGSFFFLL